MASIQQAALTALQRWFQLRIRGVEVNDRWPEPDQPLDPKPSISIVLAGKRIDDKIGQDTWKMVPIAGSPSMALYYWNGRACRQPLQIDVWARRQSDRDKLVQRDEEELNRGTRFTLNDPHGDPIRDGVLLKLDPAEGHEGFADFTFEGSDLTDTSGHDARERDYRGMIAGHVDVNLSLKAESPRMLTVRLRAALGEGQLGSGGTDSHDINLATGQVTATAP